MDLKQAVVRITDNDDVLMVLRRKGTEPHGQNGLGSRLRKDDRETINGEKNPNFKKEFLEVLFNATPYRFYVGQTRIFPLNVAQSFVRQRVPMSEMCKACKGTGSLQTGICYNCKGKKYIHTDELESIFEIIREFDPMMVDPDSVPATATGVSPAIA